MKPKYFAPRGTIDILPDESEIWQKVKEIAIDVSKKFGFYEIVLPTFENKELFIHSAGDTSDVVTKEMFIFKDRGGRELALRPEGTAPVVRSILENGLLQNPLPLKLFYIINCFRNERPQAGRYKEFYQFGVEVFGPSSPLAEFEVISLAIDFFEKLKIENLTLEINSIGCLKCRDEFKKSLIEHFSSKKEELCEDCKNRLIKNPLRLLDCKNENCIKLSENAPKILDFLCEECENHFEMVKELLYKNDIKFVVNPKIVRGLDYYTKTVFEFKTKDLGSQSTVCGGGRYDDLIENFSGEKIPALGFGIGLNRLILLIKKQNITPKIDRKCDLYIGNVTNKEILTVSKIAKKLRELNLVVCTNLLEKTVKAQMKYANKINSSFSCILGEKEIQSNMVNVKNMSTGDVFKVFVDNFENEFIKILNKIK